MSTPGVLLRQSNIVGKAELGQHDNERDLFLFAQHRDEFFELGIAFGEANPLGDTAAHDLRPAIRGESENADFHAVDLANEIGRQQATAGPAGVGLAVVIGVCRNRIPRCFCRRAREQFHGAVDAVNPIPIAHGVGVDRKAVEHIHDRLALGEEHFRGTLDRVPGVEEQGVGVLGADLADLGIHPGQTAFRPRGGLPANARTRHQMTVQITHMNECDLGSGHRRDQNAQNTHEHDRQRTGWNP